MLVYRRVHRFLNAIIICSLFGLFLIFLKAPSEDSSLIYESRESAYKRNVAEWNTIEAEYNQNLTQDLLTLGVKDTNITGSRIVESIKFINENFEILNQDKFGPIENAQIVIVVQVHNRLNYLKILIDSLRKTKGIEKALLVFSHDISILSINELIKSIDFVMVYQIFYPYNLQLFPSVYPGTGINDCPEKIDKNKAAELNCTNHKYPDKYGNYRSARLTQIKHHWWWKMNFVFDGIVDKLNLKNPWVLLLEEDHILAPDALYVLDRIIDNKNSICPICEIISLGFHLKSTKQYGSNIAKLGVHPWYSSKHNMGMALQLDTWKKIKDCSEIFCGWDDYNWDWSLMRVSVKCMKKRFRVIFTKSPRVIHIGDCGVHTHRCDHHKALDATTRLFRENSALFFPESIKHTDISNKSLKPSKENGGWGDIRDRKLCELNKYPLKRIDEQENTVLKDLLNSRTTMISSKS